MAFGDALGSIIGGATASADLSAANDQISGEASGFNANTQPYNQFGQSFLPQASQGITNAGNFASGTQSYQDFMKNYTASPGAQYTIGQAQEAQNNSAASTGQLLSGTNERALNTITQNVAGTQANTAYNEYLQGNNQQFGQLESVLGNMFSGIGVGQTATGQQAGVLNAQVGAQSQLAQAQAKADQSKGSGIGSMFGSVGSAATKF